MKRTVGGSTAVFLYMAIIDEYTTPSTYNGSTNIGASLTYLI